MWDRLHKLTTLSALAALCLAASACASGPEKKPTDLKKAPSHKAAAEVEKPSAEQLANTPCGNPDWAQLPAGAEGKAPADQSPGDQSPGDAAPANTEPADSAPADTAPDSKSPADDEQSAAPKGEHSDNVALYPDAQPCT